MNAPAATDAVEAHKYFQMALGPVQWFGSLVVLLGWIGLRAPVTRGNVEGLLLGDVLYLVVFIAWINQLRCIFFCSWFHFVGVRC